MRIRLGARAQAEACHLPPAAKAAVRAALARLEAEGLAADLELRRLSHDGLDPVYRIRVGAWRIVFLVQPEGAAVLRVFARREGYGWMEEG